MLVILKAEKEREGLKKEKEKGRVRDAQRRKREEVILALLSKILCLDEKLDTLSLWLMRIRVNSQMSPGLLKEEYC